MSGSTDRTEAPAAATPVNWRVLVMRYAAQLAEEFGNTELAASIRAWKVPFVDGGGMWRTRERDYPCPELGSRFQALGKPTKGDMTLIALPPELWDEAPDEPVCCGCSCHLKGAR